MVLNLNFCGRLMGNPRPTAVELSNHVILLGKAVLSLFVLLKKMDANGNLKGALEEGLILFICRFFGHLAGEGEHWGIFVFPIFSEMRALCLNF